MARGITQRTKKKRPTYSEKYTSAKFRPYVTAIGQLALAWNDLHEALGSLFCVIGGDILEDKLFAAWHALGSDRAKRSMLAALLKDLPRSERRVNPSAEKDVGWLLGELNRLEDLRNDAIHAPLASFDNPVWRHAGMPEGISPDDTHGNRRATKLKNKELLVEYRNCRDAAIILRDFTEAICDSWGYTQIDPTWPERPQLPNRGRKTSRRDRRRQHAAMQLPLRLKPSQK